MNEANNDQSICEMNSTSSDNGNYSLYLNNSTHKLNVINIYKIEDVTYMDKKCIYRSGSNFENFASVKFDHKIKYSDIINGSILLSNNSHNLTKYSINNVNGYYIVNFSLLSNTLTNFTEGIFSILLNNSPGWYNTSFNFTIDNKTSILDPSFDFKKSSNKVIINGTTSKKKGTFKLEFEGNITNYTINNMKTSFEDIKFENCSTAVIQEKDDETKSYYICDVLTDQSGVTIISFDICGATYKTSPIKFVQNVTEDDYNFNLKFNKILILIFLILF